MQSLLKRVPQPWRSAADWFVTIAGAVAIVLAIKGWVVNPYRIPTSSMEPTLHCSRPAQGCEARTSDRVLANRFIYHFREPTRGDIVVFNTPSLAKHECGSEGAYVKRLIGLPGEIWEERSGFVYINGQRLKEPYIKPDRRDDQTAGLSNLPPRNTYTRIPKDMYLMMGDNRKGSCDSRRFGLVPRRNLIGPVFATYWPLNRVSRGLWYGAVLLALSAALTYLVVFRQRGRETTRVESFAAGDKQTHGPRTVLSTPDRSDRSTRLPHAMERDGAKLDYAETVRLLDSWFGRRVNVAIQPDGSAWYPMYFSGQLPKRHEVGLEWLGDELRNNSEGYHFHFTDESLPTGFQLVRIDFRGARLDAEGVLAIRLGGAELTITPAKNFP